MKLNKSKKADTNYLSKIVEISTFTKHIDPEVTRLKVAHVDGYNVIVGIDEEPGKFVYFPTMSKINPQLLSYANLYRHSEMNDDHEKSGMFEDNGRVKAIKLRGMVSEGFLLPLQTMLNFIVDSTSVKFESDECPVGTEFDEVEHNGKSFWISKKYVVGNQVEGTGIKNTNRSQKKVKKFNKVIDTQFRFHYDVPRIQKVPDYIKPNDMIHVSCKFDGTSVVFANVLCKHPLTWKEKIAKFLTKREFNDYDYIYSTHHVIQNGNFYEKETPTWYGPGANIYRHAFEYIKPFIQKGMTIYAELVGYLPNNKAVMKRSCGIYDYGCVPMKEGEEFTYDKHYKIKVYRITITNVDGVVHEFSPREVQVWCNENGLVPVTEYYYGYAKDLYPDIPVDATDYGMQFIEHMSNDKRFYMEMSAPECANNVPQEGVVIRKDDMSQFAAKLKAFMFLSQEMRDQDNGMVNIEDLA